MTPLPGQTILTQPRGPLLPAALFSILFQFLRPQEDNTARLSSKMEQREEVKSPWVQPGQTAQDSGPERDAPQSEGQEQGGNEDKMSRAWPGGAPCRAVTATAITAGDREVDVGLEGVGHVGTLAPGSRGAASYGVTPVSQH